MIPSHPAVFLLLKSLNALRGSLEEASGEGRKGMEGREPLTSYHRSLDVQGGLWALVGGGGLEAIIGRTRHHVPPAGQVTSELQAELWSLLQAESTGCSQGKGLFGGSTGLSLTHGGSWHSQKSFS